MTSYFSIFQQQPRAYSITGESSRDEIIRFFGEIPPDLVIYGSSALSFEASHQMSLAGAKVLHITDGMGEEPWPHINDFRLFISAFNTYEAMTFGELSDCYSDFFIPQVGIREFRRRFGYLLNEHKILKDVRQAAVNEGVFIFDHDEVVAVIKGDHDVLVKVKSKDSHFEITCKSFLNFTEKRFELRKREEQLQRGDGIIFSHVIPLPCIFLSHEEISIFPYSKEDSTYVVQSKNHVEESVVKNLLPHATILERRKFFAHHSFVELDGRVLNLSGALHDSEEITKEVAKRISCYIESFNFRRYQRRVLPSAYGKIGFTLS